MQVLALAGRAPNEPLSAAHRVSNYSCYGTSKGLVFVDAPVFKKPLELVLPTLKPITRVHLAIERWDCVLVLSHLQLFAVSLLASQQPQSPREAIPLCSSNDATCFGMDERNDRLVIGTRRKVLIKKRLSGLRFDLVGELDLDDPCQDLCLVNDHGARWVCISGWERTVWRRSERGEDGDDDSNNISTMVLPQCDFVQQGRNSSEVLLCKAHVCTFATPSQPPQGSVQFSDSIWQVLVVGDLHLLVAGLNNHTIEVALDSGEVLQTLAGFPTQLRFSFNFWGDSGAVFSPNRQCVELVASFSAFAAKLLDEGKTGLALALAHRLPNDDPLLTRCKLEHACVLLQSRPSCSLEHIHQVLQLDILPLAPKPRFIRFFSDTDLFDSAESATKWLSKVFPLFAPHKKDVLARFQPGVFNFSLQHVFLPLLLDLRLEVGEGDRKHLVDSLLLRAFVLVNGTNPELAQAKLDFLAHNSCTVEESEFLLLSFPEMWEEHAALLNGKGQFEKGVEWLAVLGKNSNAMGDLEKYALASVRMLSQRPELVLTGKSLDWILNRVPHVGVDALVALRSLPSVSAAREFFQSKQLPPSLFKLYLQGLVGSARGDCPVQARDELALLYLDGGEEDRQAFYDLVSTSPANMNFTVLLSRLDKWPREQAVVLDRLGRRQDAAFTLATKCAEFQVAEAYALQVLSEQNVFGTVYDGLVSSGKQTAAIEFLAKHTDRLDCAKCFARLPSSLALSKDQLGMFRHALTSKIQSHRDQQMEQQLLRTEHFDTLQRLSHEQAKYVVITELDRCQGCHKALSPDHPVLVFQSKAWHYACYDL